MAQQVTTDKDATTREHAPTREDDQPGPGTLGAQRRERDLADSTTGPRRSATLRVLAVVAAIALAVAIGYLVGAEDGDVADVVSNAAAASTLQDEKDAILAAADDAPGAVAGQDDTVALQGEKEQLTDDGEPGTAVTGGDDTATMQDEKEALVAEAETAVVDGSDEAATLHDEKLALAAPDVDDAATGDEPIGEQDEKELVLAR